jgi:hypothetical protein
MAPRSTRKDRETREPEPEAQSSSSSTTQIIELIETMAANQPTETQQLAEVREQVRLLQEQLDQAYAAS